MDVAPFIPDVSFDGPFSVRIAVTSDLDTLVRIEAISQGAPWTPRVFRKELELDFSRTWVVDWEGTDAPEPIAAYLVFWIVHDEIHVLNLVVHPAARRRGFARKLVEELIRVGEENRASLISLEVRVSNEAAQRLYRSLGFVPIGRRQNYYVDNHEDADVMVRLLEG